MLLLPILLLLLHLPLLLLFPVLLLLLPFLLLLLMLLLLKPASQQRFRLPTPRPISRSLACLPLPALSRQGTTAISLTS